MGSSMHAQVCKLARLELQVADMLRDRLSDLQGMALAALVCWGLQFSAVTAWAFSWLNCLQLQNYG